MLNLKISILDYASGTANITRHFGQQKSLKGAHLVLIYNGSTHFTGTDFCFKYWDTCNTYALHFIITQTLLNSLKPS